MGFILTGRGEDAEGESPVGVGKGVAIIFGKGFRVQERGI
jgi:hypothetical protein